MIKTVTSWLPFGKAGPRRRQTSGAAAGAAGTTRGTWCEAGGIAHHGTGPAPTRIALVAPQQLPRTGCTVPSGCRQRGDGAAGVCGFAATGKEMAQIESSG